MASRAAARLGIPPATLVTVFAILAGLFAATTVVAGWYKRQQATRGRNYFEVAQQDEARGRMEEAMEGYRNALTAGSDPAYRLALAQALIRLGRLSEAEIYLQELLQADPANAVPNLLLARIAARERKTEPAINYYHRAIFGYWPEDAEKNRLAARWELIALLERTGARNQIVAELLGAADQAPNDVENRKRAAGLLLQYGSPNQAVEIFRDVLRDAPHDAAAEAGIGHAELELGNYSAALGELRRAVRVDPKNDTARRDLELVEDVLALDPTAPDTGSAGRYARSRELLERTVAAVEPCGAGSAAIEAARKRLLAGAPRSNRGEAADVNIRTAQELWQMRGSDCATAADPVLAHVFAELAK